MDYFALADNVYLVEGVVRHCLYDLNNEALYSISNEAKDILLKIISLDNKDLRKGKELEFIKYATDAGLLIRTPTLQKLIDISTIKKDYPLGFAWIEVTRACNLSCPFCYERASPSCSERMNVEQFLKVKHELKTVGINKIQFIGGEPLLLGKDLKVMIEASRDDFTKIEVYTNGTLFNQEWCDFFVNHNIHVALSIHSYLSKEHDKITQKKGSHAKSSKTVQMMDQANIPYRVAAIKTRSCRVGKKPKNSLYKLNSDYVRLVGRGNFDQYDLGMFKKKAITKETMRLRLDREKIVRNISGHKCFLKNLYIGANLDVYPCVMERRFCHGNLQHFTLGV